MNISDVNQQIIPYYSPISAKGGKRCKSRIHRTRKHKRSNKSRTRRRYHY